jgi:membrane-associated protease RseP (regulator of RpoE activity)
MFQWNDEAVVKQTVRCFLGTLALAGSSLGQTAQTPLPTDPGMYFEAAGGLAKIIGQIAEFKRSGSALVSHATVGIKSQKQNIQLLGPHAQTVVSSQPVFYFIPAKQEADAGVNAGDLILVRLEEKSERRQFEIAAHGAWRSSAGISLTHQVQLLRSEVKTGIYKIVPAASLNKGEYALYLSRGEGMAPYVYDFGVQQADPVAVREETKVRTVNASEAHPTTETSTKPNDRITSPEVFAQASIGMFSEGNPDVRHDGVTLTALTPGGPADQAGIKAGDVILAINDHYMFTIAELKEEISHHQPGTKITVRYRRYSTIYDASLVVGTVQ